MSPSGLSAKRPKCTNNFVTTCGRDDITRLIPSQYHSFNSVFNRNVSYLDAKRLERWGTNTP